MTPEQGAALDRQLTTPPSDCEEEGHNWHYLGQTFYGQANYICRRCRQESE